MEKDSILQEVEKSITHLSNELKFYINHAHDHDVVSREVFIKRVTVNLSENIAKLNHE